MLAQNDSSEVVLADDRQAAAVLPRIPVAIADLPDAELPWITNSQVCGFLDGLADAAPRGGLVAFHMACREPAFEVSSAG